MKIFLAVLIVYHNIITMIILKQSKRRGIMKGIERGENYSPQIKENNSLNPYTGNEARAMMYLIFQR